MTRDLTELLLWGKCAAGNQETILFLLAESLFGDQSPRAAAGGLRRDLCLALLNGNRHVCPPGGRMGTGSCKSQQHRLPRENYVRNLQS